MSEITRGELRALQNELGEETVKVSYSGRGMYGSACLGFSLDAASELTDLGITLASVMGPDKGRELSQALRLDAMGKGVIAYAPTWTVQAPILKTFQIETLELHEVVYTVQAEDAEEARQKIPNGEGTEIHKEFHSFHNKPAEWDVFEVEPPKEGEEPK